jgi:hypothetical protein
VVIELLADSAEENVEYHEEVEDVLLVLHTSSPAWISQLGLYSELEGKHELNQKLPGCSTYLAACMHGCHGQNEPVLSKLWSALGLPTAGAGKWTPLEMVVALFGLLGFAWKADMAKALNLRLDELLPTAAAANEDDDHQWNPSLGAWTSAQVLHMASGRHQQYKQLVHTNLEQEQDTLVLTIAMVVVVQEKLRQQADAYLTTFEHEASALDEVLPSAFKILTQLTDQCTMRNA